MDNLVFSEFICLEGIPHARFLNRATLEPVTLTRSECLARLTNFKASGHDCEETATAVASWPHPDG
jgi:hypothetical protein